MKAMFKICIILVALGLLAQAQQATGERRAGNGKAAPAVSAAEVQELRAALAAQQQQMREYKEELQQLKAELARRDETVNQAQSAALDVEKRVASMESNRSAEQVASLKSDVADIKTTLTKTAVSTQDEQKRVSAMQGVLNRLRFNGDVRVRYENFIQSYSACAAPNCDTRHRERLRLRAGFDGKLNEDFSGGIYLATGSLDDPVSTNQTLTGFFNRKTIGFDRGWITFQPHKHKWIALTGGKFAATWMRTELTFDNDLNPEGFSEKFSFDIKNPVLKNFSVTGVQLLYNESSGDVDSFAAGGQISGRIKLGSRVTISPAITLLNWRNPNTIAAAIVGRTLGGNVNTNATTADGRAYLSKFLYNDWIVDATVKTPWARFPFRLTLEYMNNLNAVSNRRHGYWIEGNVGQTREKGDFQFGYTFARIEQDAVIAAFNGSDFRAPTNLVQNRVTFQYQVARNATLGYTAWLGRTLDRSLSNAAVARGLAAGTQDPILFRMQMDAIYKF
jgi:hypothetical protein